MDGRLTQTKCDEAGDYVVPNLLSPRDLVSRPDNMDETLLSSFAVWKVDLYARILHNVKFLFLPLTP